MKHFLNIYCDGGFGNRLGALVGGVLTAEFLNLTPIISWPENNWCGCPFDELYESDLEINKKGIDELFFENLDNPFIIHSNQSKYKINEIYHPNSLSSFSHLKDSQSNIVYYNNSIPSNFTLEQVINVLEKIKINKNIKNQVLNFCEKNNIDSTTIGIHLRKTDFDYKDQDEEIIRNIVSTPNLKYFICSDDKNTEEKFNKWIDEQQTFKEFVQ